MNNKTAASGMVTMSGTLSGFSTNVSPTTTRYPTDLGEDIYITTDEGTALSFNASGSMYLTANVSDYQRYSVEMELYEWAVDTLDDVATPTYEFSVNSANFIFAQEFAPFRNQLELGKGVYLNVGGRRGKYTITPYIIEFELDFEERNQFSIVFSNRFKRHDNVNMIEGLTVEQNGVIGAAQNLTAEELEAVRAAGLYINEQKEGALTIASDGETPPCNIPVVLILLG